MNRGFFKKWPIRIAFAVFALIFLLMAVFFCRKPVIVVSDRAFNELYGQGRGQCKRITLSFRLFRPIKMINIAEGAGPDLAAQGAISLSRRPVAVFFPYRYKEAAVLYQNRRPGSQVVILAGRIPRETAGNGYEGGSGGQGNAEMPLWFNTDTAGDLYRAGAIAGTFARYQKNSLWLNTGEIALVHDGLTSSEETAFVRGLEEQQWTDPPLFLSDLAEKPLSCAVLLKDFRFYGEESAGSLILFTWMDPVLAPKKTLAIFDDSPWAQIMPVLENIQQGRHGGTVPSEIVFFRGDKIQKDVYNEINQIKILKKKAENADN